MYNYEEQKPAIFTEDGQVKFLAIRDHVAALLRQSGAIRMQEAIAGRTGDIWEGLACVDRLVELGEIIEIPQHDPAGQHRIFVKV